MLKKKISALILGVMAFTLWTPHFSHNNSSQDYGMVVAQAVTEEQQFIDEIVTLNPDQLLEISGQVTMTSKVIDAINDLAKTQEVEFLIKEGGSLVIDQSSVKNGKVVIDGGEDINFIVGRAEGKKGALITVKGNVDVTFNNSLFYSEDDLNEDFVVEGQNVKLTNSIVSDTHFSSENKIDATLSLSEISIENNTIKTTGEVSFSSVDMLESGGLLVEVIDGEGNYLSDIASVDNSTIEGSKIVFSGLVSNHDSESGEVKPVTISPNGEYTINFSVVMFDKNGNSYGKVINSTEISTYPKVEVGQFITDVYKAALGREPEAEGKSYWENSIKNKTVKAEEFVLNLLSEKEFTEKYSTTQDKIKAIYQVVVNREADAAGLDFWVQKYDSLLNANKTNEVDALIEVANNMLSENEFTTRVKSLDI